MRRAPVDRTIERAVSAYAVSRRSLSDSGRSAANSRKNCVASETGTLRVEDIAGIPSVEQMTNPNSRVRLSKKPYSFDTERSVETNTANTGTDLVLSSLSDPKNSVDDIAFLFMVVEFGTAKAIFWAEGLGLPGAPPFVF